MRPELRDRVGEMLMLKLCESTTNVRTPRVHSECASLGGVEGGVRTEGDEGASREGGLSVAGGLAKEAAAVDEGLRGSIWETGDVRAEARAAAAALTTDGLKGIAASSGGLEVGLVRPKAKSFAGSRVEAEVVAGGLTLGLLVFLRNLPPRFRWVCS